VNDEFTYVLIGKVADASLERLTIKTRTTAVPAGQARLQFVHTSSGTGPVDVYVTAPDAVLTGLSPTVAALAYRGVTDQQILPAGTVEIRVTEAGNPANVLFDSGNQVLGREADLLFAVVDYVGPGQLQHPLALSELTGISAAVIVDRNVQPSLRIVHAAAAIGPVNVTLDDGAGNTGVPAIPPGLAFGSVDPSPALYRDVPANLYTVKYIDTADTTKTLLTATLSAVLGSARTLVFAGAAATPQQLTLGDNLRRVATEGRVRLVYTSPLAGAVDIYIQPTSVTDLTTVSPNLTAAVLGSDTGYLVYLAGDYQITLTATGSKTDIKLQRTLTVANGGVYEAIVTDTVGGVAPLTLIPLDDFPAGPYPNSSSGVWRGPLRGSTRRCRP
jgi:hypothetical protein